jgi:hypothetical protein
MGSRGCLAEVQELVDFYMQQACTQVPLRRAVDVIRKLCDKYNVTLNPIFVEPLLGNISTVTGADVYTYCLLDNGDYDELFDSLCG